MNWAEEFLGKLNTSAVYQEDLDYIRLDNFPIDRSSFTWLNEQNLRFGHAGLGQFEIISEFGDDIDLDSDFADSYIGSSNIKIRKRRVYFLADSAFENHLYAASTLSPGGIYELSFIDAPFYSTTHAFVPLGVSLNDHVGSVENIKPIDFVKPINKSAQDFLPTNLLNWICEDDELLNACRSWLRVSSLKILSCLGSEISISPPSFEILFKGERRRKMIVSSNSTDLEDNSRIVHLAGRWIYKSKQDVDTRHVIFNQQCCTLVEQSIATISVRVILENAFENAALAHRYYLANSSKELHKTLTDLNKTLFEYSAKIRQGTTDLSSTMWRDFATVLAVLILNFSLKKSDIISAYFQWFGFALIAYVSISFYIASSLGFWFYYNSKDSLNSWRIRLYSYLSETEFSDYALTPLRIAFLKFRSTFFIVIAAYAAIIGSLLALIVMPNTSGAK